MGVYGVSELGIENLEASALTRASRGGLLARRSPLLRFEPDERLVKLIRAGHDGAFEALFNRYNSRLLAFCTSMLKSRQDAEDVLQEVFANAHAAMLNDERPINVRPWLYRIARNRCLNHLRRPVPVGVDSMDIHPHQNGTSTAEEVQHREDLREVLDDVRTLPETQRTALLLREIDQLSYEEIAVAMDTTVPSIKSLLVRARIGLAESSKARLLTCGEVQVELAEAAEGLAKASGPARKHVRSCETCRDFRSQLRSDRKALAALFPLGPFALIKGGFLAKIFSGGAAGSSGAAGTGAAARARVPEPPAQEPPARVPPRPGAPQPPVASRGGMGMLGSALGAKAAASVATAALLTAGAVEVRNFGGDEPQALRENPPAIVESTPAPAPQPERHASERQVAEFHADATPAPAVATETDRPAPEATAPPAANEREEAVPAEDAGTDDPTVPTEGAEIGGVGEVPTEVGPSEDQEPGSTPITPTPTTPPIIGTPPVEQTPPTTGTPPTEVSPAPVVPVPVTPVPVAPTAATPAS